MQINSRSLMVALFLSAPLLMAAKCDKGMQLLELQCLEETRSLSSPHFDNVLESGCESEDTISASASIADEDQVVTVKGTASLSSGPKRGVLRVSSKVPEFSGDDLFEGMTAQVEGTYEVSVPAAAEDEGGHVPERIAVTFQALVVGKGLDFDATLTVAGPDELHVVNVWEEAVNGKVIIELKPETTYTVTPHLTSRRNESGSTHLLYSFAVSVKKDDIISDEGQL